MEINTKYLGFFDLDDKGKPKLKDRGMPSIIVIHHTCTKSPEKTRAALKKKNYSTHFEVDVDGTVYQYTDIKKMCSHCGSANAYAIGIDVTHLEDAKFPEVQQKSVEDLVDWLCSEYGINHAVTERLEGIFPHSALCVTKCPNGFPMERLDRREENAEETDSYDVVERIRQLIGMALVDGRKQEVQEVLKRFNLQGG